MLLHQGHGVHGQRVCAQCARAGVHHIGCAHGTQVHAFFNQPAQIAIGEDAQHALLRVGHCRSAQSLDTHLAHQLAQAGIGPHRGHGIALAHDVGHQREQLAPQRTAGVRTGKVFGFKAARLQQGNSQRIAHGQLRRGAGGGCQVERAGLLGHAGVQHQVGMPGQRRLHAARQCHQHHLQPAQGRQDGGELFAFAAVGNGQHHVGGGDHAQVAVAGLTGVHKHRRRAGGGQGGGDLAADVAALAHAHHDHTAFA